MYQLPTKSPDLGARPPTTHYIPSGFLSSGFLVKKWEGGRVGHTGSWPIGCTCMEKRSHPPSLDQALDCPPLSMATTWLEAKKADRFPSLGSSYLVEAEKGYPIQRFVIKDQSK